MKSTFVRNSVGMMEKDKMYSRYVEFCEAEGIVPKEKQIFSKLVFSLYPEVRSTRLGPIGKQSHYYLGLSWREEVEEAGGAYSVDKNSGKKRKRNAKVEEEREEEYDEDEEEGEEEEEEEMKRGDHSDEDFEIPSSMRKKKKMMTIKRRKSNLRAIIKPLKKEEPQDEEEEEGQGRILNHHHQSSCCIHQQQHQKGTESPVPPYCSPLSLSMCESSSKVEDYTVPPPIVPVCLPEELEQELMTLYALSMSQEGHLPDANTFRRYLIQLIIFYQLLNY